MTTSWKTAKKYTREFFAMFRSSGLRAVVQWSRCVHGLIGLICGLNVFATLCSLGMTLVTKALVDSAVTYKSASELIKYGTLMALLLVVQMGQGVLLSSLRLRASTRLQRSMQKMFASALLSKSYTSLKGRHSGKLVNRFFSDLGTVKNGVMNIPSTLFSSAVSLIGAASILIAMDWRFVLVLIVGSVLGLAFLVLFRRPLKERHKRKRDAEEALHVSVQETLENIRIIKAGLADNRMLSKIDQRQGKLEEEQLRQGRFSILMNTSVDLVVELTWLFCMLWGCYCIYNNEMTYGSLAAIIQLIGRIEGPIIGAFKLAGSAYGMVSSAERIQELTELPGEEISEPISAFDELRLEKVFFRYEDGTDDVLRDVSFSIRPGDFVAVTGVSGGGKTSLFQLLLGLYKPTAGQVLFSSGGKAIAASKATRGLFAYVPQGNTLFSGTLLENLLMFCDDAKEEEIQACLRCACIDDLAEEIGLDAILGERGVGLSEGQAQRVAIARALLSKAPILLLDESTSALDEETEARLLHNISMLPGKTCLIVTHRKAALGICNRRLHITEGELSREDEKAIAALPV